MIFATKVFRNLHPNGHYLFEPATEARGDPPETGASAASKRCDNRVRTAISLEISQIVSVRESQIFRLTERMAERDLGVYSEQNPPS